MCIHLYAILQRDWLTVGVTDRQTWHRLTRKESFVFSLWLCLATAGCFEPVFFKLLCVGTYCPKIAYRFHVVGLIMTSSTTRGSGEFTGARYNHSEKNRNGPQFHTWRYISYRCRDNSVGVHWHWLRDDQCKTIHSFGFESSAIIRRTHESYLSVIHQAAAAGTDTNCRRTSADSSTERSDLWDFGCSSPPLGSVRRG